MNEWLASGVNRMQQLYCWRCGQVIPMLDEAEFAVIWSLYLESLKLHKQVVGNSDHPRRGSTIEELYRPFLHAYEQQTGFHETNPKAILHHRLSLYGPQCRSCGKPLRTPKASKCMACGEQRGNDQGSSPDGDPNSLELPNGLVTTGGLGSLSRRPRRPRPPLNLVSV
jgi:hypothetical protein